MNIKITPKTAKGTASAPPSKSYAHRMIICAALADGESVINGVSLNEDVSASLDCAAALGAKWELCGSTLKIRGVCGKPKSGAFPCRESGSTLRFFIPISLLSGEKVSFQGTPRLMERGIGVYEKLFSEKGIFCSKSENGIDVFGKLTSGEYILPGDVSSQFVSGLMFALPLLKNDSVIKVLPPVESRGYIDITISVLRDFGIEITETEENTFVILGGQKYISRTLEVEGDWSNGAALLALNELGSDIKVLGLNSDSLQGDKICTKLFEKLRYSGCTIDISACPDLGPVLFAVAAANHGAAFTGTRRLRIKESDRTQAMVDELKKFGIRADIEENSVIIHPGSLTRPTIPCSSHNDHRIVMAMAILGSAVGCEIEDAQAITKSYPDFFDTLKLLGMEVS